MVESLCSLWMVRFTEVECWIQRMRIDEHRQSSKNKSYAVIPAVYIARCQFEYMKNLANC